MPVEKKLKKDVWKSILRLMLPYKKTLAVLIALSILTTVNNLIEPLVYREAVNDIAGVFVKQAKDETRKELGIKPEEENTTVKTDTLHTGLVTKTVEKKKHKKEPHTRTHVASRTPEDWHIVLCKCIRLYLMVDR
jgi:hypothetical protein